MGEYKNPLFGGLSLFLAENAEAKFSPLHCGGFLILPSQVQ